jgi:hypothetical protein
VRVANSERSRNTKRNALPLLWLLLVILALFAGGGLLWASDTRAGLNAPEYSIGRTDDRGITLLYRLYERHGLNPQVWDRDLMDLKEPGLLMLIATAHRGKFDQAQGDVLPDEVKALDEWVRKGGVVAILARDPNPVYEGIGLIVDEPKSISAKPAIPLQPALLAQGVSGIRTQTEFGFKFGRAKAKDMLGADIEGLEAPIEMIPEAEWLRLFEKRDGQRAVPQVVTAARGKGLYLAVNDEFPASNLGVTMGDNARFLLNLARYAPKGGPIWFDEFHKRPIERNVVTYLRERAFGPALLYGLVILALLFWRTGTRLGEPQPLIADRRRDSGEYIRAVAALYRNAKMTREAVATQFTDFRRRLAGALRVDGLTDLEEVGRRYEQRTGRPALEARQVLIESEAALAREQLDEAAALHISSRLSGLDSVLHPTTPARDQRHGRRKGHRG